MSNLTLKYRPAILTLALFMMPLTVSANIELLCTVTADQFPGFDDGLMESKTVQLSGIQGEVGGAATIYENSAFRFRVITGRSRIQDGTATLMDFYVEAQDLENGWSTRSASASYFGGPHHARLELVTYGQETPWYERIVIFKCTESSEYLNMQ